VILVPAALVLLVVAGIVALAAATDQRGRSLVVAAIVGVVLLVLLAPVGVIVGVMGSDDGGDDAPDRSTPIAQPDRSSTTVTTARDRPSPPSVREADIELAAPIDGSAPAPTAIVALNAERGTALVEVSGLGRDRSGRMYVCLPDRCLEAVPIRSDTTGTARAILPLSPALARCRLVVDGCVLVTEGDARVVARIAARAEPRPATVHVEPATGIRPGDDVRVTLRAVPARAVVTIAQCGPVAKGEAPCTGSSRRVTADRDGSATASLEIDAGRAGRRDGGCRDDTRCYVVVTDADGFVIASSQRLRLAELPTASADYDDARVAGGLVFAAVLSLVAVLLARTTDWRAVGLPSTTDDAPDPLPDPFIEPT
jgi:hypothetical protein